jgi:lipopolysaccharide/colanic/teichoic acid biosynthesis glycosyltransferase
MKASPLMPRGDSGKENGGVSFTPDSLYDPMSGLYCEPYFKDMLCLERKRTERSKKPFLLMLLGIEGLLAEEGSEALVRRVAEALVASTREIDLKGWYTHGAVIGVIFTEISGTDKVSIKEKILDSLSGCLGPSRAGKIEMTLCVFPEECDVVCRQGEPDLSFYPELPKRNAMRKVALIMKRVLDIVGAVVGLLLFAPFFVVIPVLIKKSSKGPVFFKQERVGQYGRTFSFLKFRTMYANSDPRIHQDYIKKLICEQKAYDAGSGSNGGNGKDGTHKDGEEQACFKIKDDPRITPIGKFLRKTSLDELPQFINVLKGDMSLVGPRPPIPYELENYDLWHRRRVLEVKPGITGLWQVYGRSRTNFDDMVRLDLKYVREWSLALDMKIIVQTPMAVIGGKGAH